MHALPATASMGVQTAGFLLIADIAAKSIETFAGISTSPKSLTRARRVRRCEKEGFDTRDLKEAKALLEELA